MGDRASLELLLRNSYDTIYAVCRRMTGNDQDGADAAQEALIAVARGVERFDGRSKFSTWVYRVAMNKSIDELRRRSRRATVSLDGLSDSGLATLRPLVSSRPATTPRAPSIGSTSTPRCVLYLSTSGSRSCSAISAAWSTPRSPRSSRSVRHRPIAGDRAGRAALVGRLGGVEEGRT